MAEAINLGTLYGSIEMRTSKLEEGAKQSGAIIDKMAGDITRRMNEIGRSFESTGHQLTVGLTLPLAALGAAAFKQALEMDTLKRSLTAVAGSTQEMNRQMERAKEIAKLPGLGFKESVEGLVKLQAGGFKFEEASRTLMAFGNALAVVGKGKNELSAVNEQLSQMVGKGKVMQEDVRIIQQYVPQLRQAMKGAFGTADTEAIQKMGIPIQEFLAKINTELEKLPKMTGGVKNAIENFSDASQRALDAVGKAILPIAAKLLDNVTPAIERAGEAFTRLPESAKNAILGTSGIAATAGIGALAIGKIITAVEALKVSMATPIILKIALVGITAEALIALADMRMKSIDSQQAKEDSARRGLFGGEDNLKRVRGYRQFEIKPFYSDSLKKTLGNINRENQDIALPTIRREAINRDAERMIADAEKAITTAVPRFVRLTDAGKLAQLLAQMEQAKKAVSEIEGKIALGPKSDEELNKLGSARRGGLAKIKSLQEKIDAFDPEIQKQKAEDAARDAEKVKESARKQYESRQTTLQRVAQLARETQKMMDDAVQAGNKAGDKAAAASDAARKSAGMVDTEMLSFIGPTLGRILDEDAAQKSNKRINDYITGQEAILERNQSLKREQDEFLKDARQQNAQRNSVGMFGTFENMANGLRDTGAGVINTAEKMADQLQRSMRKHLDFGEEFGELLAEKFGKAFGRGTDRHFREIGRNITDVFSNLFENILNGQKNFLQSFLDDFKRMIVRLIAQIAASKVMEVLTGLFGGGTGPNGAGGGGKSKVPASGSLAGLASMIPGIGGAVGAGIGALGSIFHFADGGRPPVGRFSLVGERGPELVKFDRAATVYPNGVMPTGVDEMGGRGINIHGDMHFHGVHNIRDLSRELAVYTQRSLPFR